MSLVDSLAFDVAQEFIRMMPSARNAIADVEVGLVRETALSIKDRRFLQPKSTVECVFGDLAFYVEHVAEVRTHKGLEIV